MQLNIVPRIFIIVGCVSSLSTLPLFFTKVYSLKETCILSVCLVLLSLALTRFFMRDVREGLSALELGLLNLKDGEYATTLSYNKRDQLGDLCQLYNATALKLRDEKHGLYQRELLLDKVTQSSPETLFLVNSQQQIVFCNIAAKRFFNMPNGLEGLALNEVFAFAPKGIETVVLEKKDGLFTLLSQESEAQTWHLSTGKFILNGQDHTLFILKQMTKELSRQEVAVWKKVIRIISHELNNSLGPISSMLHSGKLLSENLEEERLARVFSTIDERIKHLSDFVQGYGKFAKLPEPQISANNWNELLCKLSTQWQFVNQTPDEYKIDETEIFADEVQLEQLLINLLKNAHESGSLAEHINVTLKQGTYDTSIFVSDKGKGMSASVMENALVPFYSTKASGTGLGLALCREITDAHHGHISLYNKNEGGITVKITLPNNPTAIAKNT